MRVKKYFILSFLVFTGCLTGVKSVDVKEAAQLLIETPDVFVLDARTNEEHQKEHLKGAVLIPYKEVAQHLKDLPSKKETLILVYCTVGMRSAIATRTLQKNGYVNATNIKGGIKAWKKNGYPVLLD